MGIVAYCPAGHRVKVKEHLAGRKGICPECGARFRIPVADAAAPAAEHEPAGRGADPPRQPVPAGPLAPDSVALVPAGADVGAAGVDGAAPASVAAAAPAAAPSTASLPTATFVSLDAVLAATLPCVVPLDATPAAAGAGGGAWHPLLAAAPTLPWSIAEPGGEASAPKSAAEMHAWLHSGQVRGSELVWRADWADWVGVGTAFPEHVPPADAAPAAP